jgi:hypothetical protein
MYVAGKAPDIWAYGYVLTGPVVAQRMARMIPQ